MKWVGRLMLGLAGGLGVHFFGWGVLIIIAMVAFGQTFAWEDD